MKNLFLSSRSFTFNIVSYNFICTFDENWHCSIAMSLLWTIEIVFSLRTAVSRFIRLLFYLRFKVKASLYDYVNIAQLITYFGNFGFGFSSLTLSDFQYNTFHLKGKMGKRKWKINELLHNILVTSLPKTSKNEVTKMGWNAHIFRFILKVTRAD